MTQYRITSACFVQQDHDDCYLAPDDPVHELKIAAQLGGLGSEVALAKYNQSQLLKIISCDKGRVQRENNIKPGTPAWFELWFSQRS